MQADNETYMQTPTKYRSVVLATVPRCRYHLGHCSLFHIFRPKVGGYSHIGFNQLYMALCAFVGVYIPNVNTIILYCMYFLQSYSIEAFWYR